ncbi:MAG: DUF935 domain-containing protein, partial [Alphaproteobacteria bacterium]|nr:DUF935 domain-containing protein [Alphaproteobacteria bacterium]
PSVGLTPRKLARLLRDAEDGDPEEYLALAEEMEEKDLHYRGVMGTRKRAVSQLDIAVEPAGDSKDDEANAQLIRDFLSRDGLEDELFDILDAIGKGYSVTEIIWETSASQWMPKELKWVDPRWFELDQIDRRTLYLKSDEGALPLKPYKYIPFFAKGKSGLPIRGGMARAAAWSYLFKTFDLKSWVTFAEVYGQPLRIGKYHAGATDKDKRTLLRAVSNIGTDAAAIIPQNMLIEFVKAEQKGSADLYEKLAKFLDQQVSKAVLGQTTTTDAISGGHAVGKEHNDVRGDIERSDAKQLAATLKKYVVIPIIDLNRGPQKRYPSLKIGRAEKENLEALSKTLEALVPLGLKVSQTEVRGKLGLKAPETPDDTLGSSEPVKTETATAMHRQSFENKDDVDGLVEMMMEDWEQDIEPVITPVRQAFDEAESYDD